MRSLFLLTLPVLLGGAACSATAEGAPEPWKRVVLVELFTSQGCSSCPAADALVRELPRLGLARDRVVPLAYHVDYWDGLGWKDPFASAAFTKRQEWYARSNRLLSPDGPAGLRGPYTPQMIVAGAVQFSGQRRTLALAEIRRAASKPAPIDLAATAVVKGPELAVTARITPRPPGDGNDTRDWRLVVALVQKVARTRVLRGENSGESLQEAAIVRALSEPVPISLAGRDSVTARLVKPAELRWQDLELAAFVQSDRTGEVAAALALDVPSVAP